MPFITVGFYFVFMYGSIYIYIDNKAVLFFNQLFGFIELLLLGKVKQLQLRYGLVRELQHLALSGQHSEVAVLRARKVA